jgi:hypothetical protein
MLTDKVQLVAAVECRGVDGLTRVVLVFANRLDGRLEHDME